MTSTFPHLRMLLIAISLCAAGLLAGAIGAIEFPGGAHPGDVYASSTQSETFEIAGTSSHARTANCIECCLKSCDAACCSVATPCDHTQTLCHIDGSFHFATPLALVFGGIETDAIRRPPKTRA